MTRTHKAGGASERILETTFRLLSERGYARVSMRDIAREANVAVSQIAYYFKNKRGLFSAVIERTVHMIVEEARPYFDPQRDKGEWRRTLREFSRGFMTRHPQHLRVMMDLLVQSQWEPGFREEISGLVHRLEENAWERLGGEKSRVRAMFNGVLGALLGTAMQGMLGIRSEEDEMEFGEGMIPVFQG